MYGLPVLNVHKQKIAVLGVGIGTSAPWRLGAYRILQVSKKITEGVFNVKKPFR